MDINLDNKLGEEAHNYIAHHKNELIKHFADPGIFKKVEYPVSLFMAGSPGAGKTEVSRNLVKRFETKPIRIDADEIRAICKGYSSNNAHLFQRAATKGVNILFDYALHNNIHAIIDGTFAYGNAMKNIRRSLGRERIVELWFIYQDPLKAWDFTKIREAVESRHVDKDVFIRSFLKAKENTMQVKNVFGDNVELNLLIKNIDNSNSQLHLNIKSEELDRYIGRAYTEDELRISLI